MYDPPTDEKASSGYNSSAASTLDLARSAAEYGNLASIMKNSVLIVQNCFPVAGIVKVTSASPGAKTIIPLAKK